MGHTVIDVHRGNRAAGAVGSVGARSLKRTRIRSKGVYVHKRIETYRVCGGFRNLTWLLLRARSQRMAGSAILTLLGAGGLIQKLSGLVFRLDSFLGKTGPFSLKRDVRRAVVSNTKRKYIC